MVWRYPEGEIHGPDTDTDSTTATNTATTGTATTTGTASTTATGTAITRPGPKKPTDWSTTTKMTVEISDLRFNALRSALYHGERGRFFDARHRWISFFVIVFGSGAAGSIAAENNQIAFVLAIFAALSSGFSLAFDPSGHAREHGYLRRKFYELLASIETCADNDEELRNLSAKLTMLYGEERPHMKVVNLVAYNDAGDSIYGVGEKERFIIPWWRAVTKNFFSHDTVKTIMSEQHELQNIDGG